MEDFVTFELAIKLKEKGFPQHWSDHHYILENEYEDDSFEVGAKYPVGEIYVYIPSIAAPTISQVLKWLREEKLILIGLSPMQEYDGDEVVEWCANIYKTDNKGGLRWKEELYYQSYEAAALAGIEYVLENLI